MTDVSGDPEEMGSYVERVQTARGEVETRLTAVQGALDDLAGALVGFSVPDIPDVAAVLGRVRTSDDFVGVVGQRFADVGTPGDDGYLTLDDAVLQGLGYESLYSQSRREYLRRRAEEELAHLRESEGDPTTTGELVAIAGWMAEEVEQSNDPAATAAALIDTMGAGDLQVMLDMLETSLDERDGVGPRQVQATLEDIAVVTSHGLQGNPGRANRWVGEISQNQDWYHDGPPEMLIALGAMVAPGTSTLGLSVWRDTWAHTYTSTDQGTVFTGQHVGGEGGPLEQLTGTNNAIQALAESAGAVDDQGRPTRPELANAIVTDVAEAGSANFEHLFAQGGTANPALGEDPLYDALGSMLTASVDPSLPIEARTDAALATMDAFAGTLDDDVSYHYTAAVHEGIGRVSQPLLEQWSTANRGTIVPAGADAQAEGHPTDENLTRAITELSRHEAGAAGLATATDGAMQHLLWAEVSDVEEVDPATVPFDSETLERTGEMLDMVTEAAVEGEIDRLVDAVEGGGWDPAVQAAVIEGLGMAPDPRVQAVGTLLAGASAGAEQDVGQSYDVLPPAPADRLTYYLVVANVREDATYMSDALIDEIHELEVQQGPAGVAAFLANDDLEEGRYPGFHELQRRINAQMDAVGTDTSEALVNVFLDR